MRFRNGGFRQFRDVPKDEKGGDEPDCEERVLAGMVRLFRAGRGGESVMGARAEPDEEAVGRNDGRECREHVRPEADGCEAVGVVRQAERDRAEAEHRDDFPAFAADGPVDQAELLMVAEPALDGIARDVARDEEIGRRAEIRAERDGDPPFPETKARARGDRDRREGDDDHLKRHDRDCVGKDAEPAEMLEFFVGGEEEFGKPLHVLERMLLPESARIATGSRMARRLMSRLADTKHPRVLTSLKVRHFRCFEEYAAEFAPGMNFIVGPNARGKTSLLEAACILLRLQSPRVTRLAHVIQHERRGLVVDGYFAQRHMQYYLSRERKKLALDGVEQKTAREYLDIARLVYFGNRDIELVRGAGEGRRRFLDFVAAQLDGSHRRALRDYERALRSRNLLLKSSAPRWREIAAFDEPLLAAGGRMAAARSRLVDDLQEPVNAAHEAISGAREKLRLELLPGCGEDFAATLAAAQKEDARLRQTTTGPHRDDVAFFLNDQSSAFASEGQQRTLVLALKLGAARLIGRHFSTPPVLLLDDIFGEHDLARRAALLAALPEGAQKIITTTHLDWMPPDSAAHVLRLA